MTLRGEDDLRHPPAEPGGRARDSLFWQVTLPEERLAVQVYLFLSGSGRGGYHVAVWGPRGRIAYAVGGGTVSGDLDDAELDGLRLRQGVDLRTATLGIRRPDVELDLRFEGVHEAFSFHDDPDGLPAWFAADRMEQTGRVTGVLRLADAVGDAGVDAGADASGGVPATPRVAGADDDPSGGVRTRAGWREIPLDATGHRDHSWGVRDWRAPQHWKWFVAYTPDARLAVNGWIWLARGTWGFGGYVLRGDELSPVSLIDVTEATYDEAGRQTRFDAVVVDVDGRELHVELDVFGVLELPDDRSGTIVLEGAATGALDGEDARGQYECEWPADYFARCFGRDDAGGAGGAARAGAAGGAP